MAATHNVYNWNAEGEGHAVTAYSLVDGTGKQIAQMSKDTLGRKRVWVLRSGPLSVQLPARATFDHAEEALRCWGIV